MIALLSTPLQVHTIPTAAIFFLKGCLKEEGIDSTCYDLNSEFTSHFNADSVRMWCEYGTHYKPEYGTWIKKYCEKLVDYDWIGISVFTYNSQVFTRKLLQILRPMTKAKIVLGGLGLTNSGSDVEVHTFDFGGEMKKAGLVDYVIKGEGDKQLPNLIKGKPYTSAQIDCLDNLPFPDYSDVDLNNYPHKVHTVTGSRGCVRNCTFCDVGGLWKKYRYRPGKDIANEIVEMHYKYGIDYVNFSDSLVNGSMKAFREFCIALAEANIPVKWRGMFIFRSGMTQKDWDMIKASGCHKLDIGIESGSQRVRYDMKKKFTNECMYDSIDELGKRGITMTYLMMVGYPTETEEDFQDTIDLLNWSSKYKELIEVRTNIVMIVRNTPLYEDIAWYDHAETWRFINDDGELTFSERFRRWKKAIATIKRAGLIPDNRQFQLEDVFKIRLQKERERDHSKVRGIQVPLDQMPPPMDSLAL